MTFGKTHTPMRGFNFRKKRQTGGAKQGGRQKNKPAVQTYGTGFLINPYENKLLLLCNFFNLFLY